MSTVELPAADAGRLGVAAEEEDAALAVKFVVVVAAAAEAVVVVAGRHQLCHPELSSLDLTGEEAKDEVPKQSDAAVVAAAAAALHDSRLAPHGPVSRLRSPLRPEIAVQREINTSCKRSFRGHSGEALSHKRKDSV